MGDVHALTEIKAGVVMVRCRKSWRLVDAKGEVATAWEREVTCEGCAQQQRD